VAVAEHLFVNVACEMKRLYSNVSAAQRSLQQRPEILHPIHMHAATDVSLSLVDYIVDESALHSVVVGDRVIGVHGAAVFHILENLILQGLARTFGTTVARTLRRLRSRIPCTIVLPVVAP